jgi:hypothetical protein
MDFQPLIDKSETVGKLKALTELREKIQDESVLREITLDNGGVFSGNLINTAVLLKIINEMIEKC